MSNGTNGRFRMEAGDDHRNRHPVISIARSTSIPARKSFRRWIGIGWLVIESMLIGGNIFGFGALFSIMPKYGIYNDSCANQTFNASVEFKCEQRTVKYQVERLCSDEYVSLILHLAGSLNRHLVLQLDTIDYWFSHRLHGLTLCQNNSNVS